MSVTIKEFGVEKIDDLVPYKKNPRKGDIKMIAESLKRNGQYKPIIINKKSKEILVGNHTWKAAQTLGWKEITVGYVDVKKAEAKRIMLADNRTSDAGTYDYELLAEVIAELPDVEGTGYTETDRDMLTQSIKAATEDTTRQLEEIVHETPSFGIIQPPTEMESIIDATAGEEGASGLTNPNPEADETFTSLDDVTSDLEGILELKESIIFPVENDWGIPMLRRDKLVKKLPDNLGTWAGADVTPDDGVKSFLYNYGVDSARGMPWDRAILSFYTHDIHFENWWRLPAHYAAKVINAGIKMAVAPNFSMFDDDPPIITFWSIYRSYWLARYLQEANVDVIPDIKIPNAVTTKRFSPAEMTKIGVIGIPNGAPVVALQVQNVRPHEKELISYMSDRFSAALEVVQPKHILVYGAKTGHKLVESMRLGIPTTNLFNRAHLRRGVVFDNKKGYDITEIESTEKNPKRRKAENPHSYGTTLPKQS